MPVKDNGEGWGMCQFPWLRKTSDNKGHAPLTLALSPAYGGEGTRENGGVVVIVNIGGLPKV
jgi:hypothetical protein